MSDRESGLRSDDLRPNWARFEEACRVAPVGFAMLDTELHYLYINEWLAKLNGPPASAHIGRSIQEMIPNTASLIEQICREVLRTGDPEFQFELSSRESKGEQRPRHLLANFIPFSSDDGKPVGLTIIAQDITDLVEAEKNLRAEKEFSEAVIQSHPGVLTVLDLDGKAVLWNRQMMEQTGYSEADLRRGNAFDAVHPKDRARAKAMFDRVIEEGVGSGEFVALDKDGSSLQILVNAVRTRIQGKDHVVVMSLDISQLKKAEEELALRYRFETLIRKLSGSFINLPADRVGEQMNQGLQEIREFLSLDRCTLLELVPGEQHMQITQHVALPGVPPSPTEIDPDLLPWLAEHLRQGRSLSVASPDELPAMATEERAYAHQEGIKSFAFIPLSVGGNVLGAMALDSFREQREWPEALVQRLNLIGEIFANALLRRRADQELEHRYQFESLVRELSARFINLPPGKVDAEIDRALQRVIEFLDLDRSTIAEFPPDGRPPRISHSCTRNGIPKFPDSMRPDSIPRFVEALLRGEPVVASSLDDLPIDATSERDFLAKQGIKSIVLVPLTVGGEVLGTLSFVKIRERRDWSDGLVQRFALIGDILANALVRRRKEDSLRSALREIEVLKDQLEADYSYLEEEIRLEHSFENVIGRSESIRSVLQQVELVAPTESTVLILGETGTGKELVARAIHELSSRRGRPLVKVNCAALPVGLIESEIFGHKKGAFSGAQADRDGRFQLADGTTLFLDEIGELPPETQAKLLRVLQDGEFEPLGSSTTIKVDVRVLAATNRDLENEVREGRFREDLWYRLSVYPIHVPSLRERMEDVPVLAQTFLSRSARKLGKQIDSITPAALNALQRYSWPGNVRELENVIERGVIECKGSELQLRIRLGGEETPVPGRDRSATLDQLQHDHISKILRQVDWRVEGDDGAAAILGLNPSTLRARMRKLGIQRP